MHAQATGPESRDFDMPDIRQAEQQLAGARLGLQQLPVSAQYHVAWAAPVGELGFQRCGEACARSQRGDFELQRRVPSPVIPQITSHLTLNPADPWSTVQYVVPQGEVEQVPERGHVA